MTCSSVWDTVAQYPKYVYLKIWDCLHEMVRLVALTWVIFEPDDIIDL